MLYDGRATDALDRRPSCSMCGAERSAVADAKTMQGPWGYLCMGCFVQNAYGLGIGRGQFLLCGDEIDAGLLLLLDPERCALNINCPECGAKGPANVHWEEGPRVGWVTTAERFFIGTFKCRECSHECEVEVPDA